MRNIYRKIWNVILFTVSILLSWGGMLYAVDDPNHFRFIGVIISLIGYGLFFWAVIRYESEENS